MNTMCLVEKVGAFDSEIEHVGVFVSFKEARKYVDLAPTTEVVEGYYLTPTAEKKTRQVSYRITSVDVHPEPRVHPDIVDRVLVVAQEFFPDRPVRLKYDEETDMLFITLEMDYQEGPELEAKLDAEFEKQMRMSDALQALGLWNQHYNISTGIAKGPEDDV